MGRVKVREVGSWLELEISAWKAIQIVMKSRTVFVEKVLQC